MTEFYDGNFGMRRPGILAANACFWLAGVGLVLLNILARPLFGAIYGLFGPIGDTAALFLADAVYYLPCLLLPGLLLARKYGAEGMRLGPLPMGMAVMSVLVAVLCVPAVNALTLLWSALLEGLGLALAETDIAMETTGDLMMGVLALGVMPGICEELLFRGAVLGGYEGHGTKRAIFISALLFASLHGSVQGLPGQFLMGLVLGTVVCHSGSLYAGMILHTTYNSALLMLTYAIRDIPVDDGGTLLEGLGGGIGMLSIVLECAVVLAILWMVMGYFRRRSVGDWNVPGERKPLGVCELLVLISGVVTVIYLYCSDILYMMGVAL